MDGAIFLASSKLWRENVLNKNKICGLFLVAIGFFAGVMTLGFNVKLMEGDPGPKLFPMIGIGGMIIFGICIFFQQSTTEKPHFSREAWIKVITVFGLFALYVLMLKYIGYIISTLIILFIITTMFSKGKNVSVIKRAIFTVIITLSVYILFVKILHVMLPTGLLF